MKRIAIIAAASILAAAPVVAGPALPFTGILGKASDSALDKLAQPGAFYADEAVRIALPGPLKNASGIMKFADSTGLTNGLSKSINDAAGMAAGEAKPIFRSAISKMTVADAAKVVGKGDGGTRYLQQSAGDELKGKVRPLILRALGTTGAFGQLDKMGSAKSLLGKVGVSHDGLTDSVTSQAMSGIFNYMGKEEGKARANPLDTGGKLLKGLTGK